MIRARFRWALGHYSKVDYSLLLARNPNYKEQQLCSFRFVHRSHNNREALYKTLAKPLSNDDVLDIKPVWNHS